jgi:hypothetical protein
MHSIKKFFIILIKIMAEVIYIPVIIAAINTTGLIISEYLGSRPNDPSNPNMCRSILGVCYSGIKLIQNKINASSTPTAPEEIEMTPSVPITSTSRPNWMIKP